MPTDRPRVFTTIDRETEQWLTNIARDQNTSLSELVFRIVKHSLRDNYAQYKPQEKTRIETLYAFE